MNNNSSVLSKIYKILTSYPEADQRYLAEQLDLSLGSTNSILRVLCKSGFLNITPVNLKKSRYELSESGITEVTNYHKKCVLEARDFARGQGIPAELVGLVG